MMSVTNAAKDSIRIQNENPKHLSGFSFVSVSLISLKNIEWFRKVYYLSLVRIWTYLVFVYKKSRIFGVVSLILFYSDKLLQI